MKIERLYSNYQEEERLYSTGNDELDDLLERAFCEGYEYAQREFAKPGYVKKEAAKRFFSPTGNRKKYKRNILEEAEKRIEERHWYPEKVKKLHSGNLKERGEVLKKEANEIRSQERFPMYFEEDINGSTNIKGQPQRVRLITRNRNIQDSKGRGNWDELYTSYKKEGFDSSRKSLNESRKSDYKRMKKEYPDLPVA